MRTFPASTRSIIQRCILLGLLSAVLPASAGPTYDLCVMFFTRDFREVAKDMCLTCKYQKFTGQPVDADCVDAAAAAKPPAVSSATGSGAAATAEPARETDAAGSGSPFQRWGRPLGVDGLGTRFANTMPAR